MVDTNSLQDSIAYSKKCILTNREIEYLALASLGYKKIEIAGILSYSVKGISSLSVKSKLERFE